MDTPSIIDKKGCFIMATQYSEEFRKEAVQLVIDSKSSLAQVAKDLGVSSWTLRGWVKKRREAARSNEPQRAETLEEENRRLKRELAVLRMERDLLKKAAAYFAKEHL
jgi:transposase